MFDFIRSYYKEATLVDKIIGILLVVFLVTIWFSYKQLNSFFLLPDFATFIIQPWTILTYSFIHENFISLISNVIILYFLGHLFLDFFNERQLLIYLILGSVFGGLAYLIFNRIFDTQTTFLSGFSMAMTCVFTGLVTKIPRYNLYLRLIGAVKIWFIFAVWILLLSLAYIGVNKVAIIALAVSVLTGFVLTRFFDEGFVFTELFSTKKKSTPLSVYRNQSRHVKPSYRTKKNIQKEIDRILDKISASGYESLSAQEKEFLFNQKDTNDK